MVVALPCQVRPANLGGPDQAEARCIPEPESAWVRCPLVGIVGVVTGPVDRIVRAERPIVTALMLIGVGFALSLLVGLLFGSLGDDFQLAFGRTVAVGLIVTSVVTIALLAMATRRRQE